MTSLFAYTRLLTIVLFLSPGEIYFLWHSLKVPVDGRKLSCPDKTGKMINPGKRTKTLTSSRYIINVVNNSTALQMTVKLYDIGKSKNICEASGQA